MAKSANITGSRCTRRTNELKKSIPKRSETKMSEDRSKISLTHDSLVLRNLPFAMLVLRIVVADKEADWRSRCAVRKLPDVGRRRLNVSCKICGGGVIDLLKLPQHRSYLLSKTVEPSNTYYLGLVPQHLVRKPIRIRSCGPLLSK